MTVDAEATMRGGLEAQRNFRAAAERERRERFVLVERWEVDMAEGWEKPVQAWVELPGGSKVRLTAGEGIEITPPSNQPFGADLDLLEKAIKRLRLHEERLKNGRRES